MPTDRSDARQLSEYDRQREEGYVLRDQERRWGTCKRCNAILYGYRCAWCEPEGAGESLVDYELRRSREMAEPGAVVVVDGREMGRRAGEDAVELAVCHAYGERTVEVRWDDGRVDRWRDGAWTREVDDE